MRYQRIFQKCLICNQITFPIFFLSRGKKKNILNNSKDIYNVYPLDFSTFISHRQRHDLTINLTLRGVFDESESPIHVHVHPSSQNKSLGDRCLVLFFLR